MASLKDHVTLPQHFSAHGYFTATSGKVFHDGSIAPADRPREFQVWGTTTGPPYPPKKFVHTPDDIAAMDWGVFPERDEDQADWKIADSAIAQLKQTPKDRPFFVAVGFRLPHVPCFASQKWFDLYPEQSLLLPEVRADDRDDVPAFSWFLHWKLPEPRLSWLKKANQWRPLVRAYLASTSFMDSQVGRVLDALDATGRAKETVVVLWSDHGWHLGEKGITGKNTLWERSTRVPLIFAGPGVSAGATVPGPWSCSTFTRRSASSAACHRGAVSTAIASCPCSRTRTPPAPGRPSQPTTGGTTRSARSAGVISVTPTAPRNCTTTATTPTNGRTWRPIHGSPRSSASIRVGWPSGKRRPCRKAPFDS